jgi:hypothetical protein
MIVAWLIATIVFVLSYVSPCRHLPSEQVPLSLAAYRESSLLTAKNCTDLGPWVCCSP